MGESNYPVGEVRLPKGFSSGIRGRRRPGPYRMLRPGGGGGGAAADGDGGPSTDRTRPSPASG